MMEEVELGRCQFGQTFGQYCVILTNYEQTMQGKRKKKFCHCIASLFDVQCKIFPETKPFENHLYRCCRAIST